MSDELDKSIEELLKESKEKKEYLLKDPSVKYSAESQLYSVEEYFELNDCVEFELIYGRLVQINAPKYNHQRVALLISMLFNNFITLNKGKCKVIPVPFCVVLDEDDRVVVQPDISVICNLELLRDGYCDGAPDIIVEIVSPSNKNHDYHQKLALYKKYGVKEYWIVDLELERVTLYNLVENGVPRIHGKNDVIDSIVLKGFSLKLKDICEDI